MSDEQTVTDKPTTRRKISPIFVTDPGPPSSEYVEGTDPFGRPGELHQAESPEAASHWDARHWRPSRNR